MKKDWLLALFVLLIGLDLWLTFVQNYHMPFDGDVAIITVPRPDYAPILHDPFGWGVLRHQANYVGPNRFFAHITLYWYFRQVPLWLQHFVSPITSAYAAMAIANTALQALMLYVLGWYATGTRRLSSLRLWVAMVLMMPLFQTSGYHMQLGVVTTSISFALAYTLPLLLLLVLFWPLYRAVRWGQPLHLPWPQLVAMLLLIVVLAFNGPVVPGTVLVLALGLGLYEARRRWQAGLRDGAVWRWFPWQATVVWGWLGLLCLYSLYLGTHNSESFENTIPLWERYKVLPAGIFEQLTVRLGLPLLILWCIANVQLIRRQLPATPETKRLALLLRWLGWFAALYIILLPLGGYRGYRPLILRYDTILPITIGLVAFYAVSTAYLLRHLAGRAWGWYLGGVLAMSAIFMNADRNLYPGDNNLCERQALEILAHAGPAPVVLLPDDCPVMTWKPVNQPSQSVVGARMLAYWGVTKGLKLYYHPVPKPAK